LHVRFLFFRGRFASSAWRRETGSDIHGHLRRFTHRTYKQPQNLLAPLAFPSWTLATVIPEAEFLGPIETTIWHLLIGLAILILAAGILSAWLARRVIAEPLITVVDELKHVERFELDQVRRHPSRLAELENLSNAIGAMAGGLAAFRKYIPADLVKMLVSQGVEPRPGGSIRTLTVMFADITGFTGLSERLGDQIIPVLSSYLDIMSREVSSHGGTIDKFIGDAVMAFWGAPADNADHAFDACRTALACQRALRASGLILHLEHSLGQGSVFLQLHQ
jgi:adenylate cyclase